MDNVGLACAPHNAHMAELDYGKEKMAGTGARPTESANLSPRSIPDGRWLAWKSKASGRY